MYFYHVVNGHRYTSKGITPKEPQTLEEYKNMIRKAYGSLRGVKVGVA